MKKKALIAILLILSLVLMAQVFTVAQANPPGTPSSSPATASEPISAPKENMCHWEEECYWICCGDECWKICYLIWVCPFQVITDVDGVERVPDKVLPL